MLILVLAIAAIGGAGDDLDDGGDVATDDPPATGPPAPRRGFGDGTRLVHDEVTPGLYLATEADGCHWERRRSVEGRSGQIIAADDVSGQAIVEIVATDVAFHSIGCGRWVRFVAPPSPADSFGDGDYGVNTQIQPGRYRSAGGSPCYWVRSTDFRREGVDGVIADGNVDGPAVVEIARTDVAFSSSGCGGWRKVA
jgi:hypothetical protein